MPAAILILYFFCIQARIAALSSKTCPRNLPSQKQPPKSRANSVSDAVGSGWQLDPRLETTKVFTSSLQRFHQQSPARNETAPRISKTPQAGRTLMNNITLPSPTSASSPALAKLESTLCQHRRSRSRHRRMFHPTTRRSPNRARITTTARKPADARLNSPTKHINTRKIRLITPPHHPKSTLANEELECIVTDDSSKMRSARKEPVAVREHVSKELCRFSLFWHES